MRAFRVGDQFKGKHSGLRSEVTWVDPQDRFRAVIKSMKGSEREFVDETVHADQFLNHWMLIKEGPTPSAY